MSKNALNSCSLPGWITNPVGGRSEDITFNQLNPADSQM
jgi:hypothetical protein